MKGLFKLTLGAAYLLLAAAALGITINAVRPDGLPLIRKPLRETRRIVPVSEIIPPPQADEAKPKPEPQNPKPADKAEPQPPAAADDKPIPVLPKTNAIKPLVSVKPSKPAGESKPKPKPQPAPVAVKKEALFTNLADAKKLFDAKNAVFVDARPPEDYEAEHIPGALSLYHEKLAELYNQVLGNISKDRIIVTYCSDPECLSALKLADSLLMKGHKNVYIMLEGLPGWKEAGYPTVGKANGG